MHSIGPRMFREYRDFLYEITGIHIDEHKEYLLQSKVSRLVNRSETDSAKAYLDLISQPGKVRERQEFIDMMTTNTTEFFRESEHFDYLGDRMAKILHDNPRIASDRVIRVWSAACSTGQEPVTLALVLRQLLGDTYKIKVLATDISTDALNRAVTGAYSASECSAIPEPLLKKYFCRSGESYIIGDQLRSMITYRHFNLMKNFNFKWGFDVIFCRNVMIYFDNLVQQSLANKFYGCLVPGGLLFLGHSESLLNKQHRFKLIGHSIYQKS
ncbi:MAG: CheR family methyltransferase [Chitinophagales bacterium]